MKFRFFQPDFFECSLVRDADGSVNRRGFARRTVIPGLRGKCAHGRSPLAETPVNIALAGSRISAVLRGHMALASHSWSCDGCGDQCSRQKFKTSHLISPLDMKSQQRVASLWKWSSDRPIKVTFPHVASTLREVGHVGTIIHPVRVPQDQVSFVTLNLLGRHRCLLTSSSRHPSTWMLANEKLAPREQSRSTNRRPADRAIGTAAS
jgi:hypothetical protein